MKEVNKPDNIIHMTLKAEWFDMIADDIKHEEYRDRKPYWEKRLRKVFTNPDKQWIIRFKNGYAKDARKMDVIVNGISESEGNTEWGAESGVIYYNIKLGARYVYPH